MDADFLSYQVGLLDWGTLHDTLDVDLQDSLLTDFANHLYRVCVPVRWKLVSDPRYPCMTLEIRDVIRWHDRMRTSTVAFRSAKPQVANMMRSASARFVERDFYPGWPQRVLWSNFRRLGFCNSSDFSSISVGVEDFADFFANIPVPSIQIPTASGPSYWSYWSRRMFFVSAFKSITSNAVEMVGISVKFLKTTASTYLLSCVKCFQSCNHLFCFSFYVEGGYYLASC
jgi:hypothetical protein